MDLTQQDKEQNRRNQVDNTFFNLLDMHLKMKSTIEENNTFETFYNEIGLDANEMIKIPFSVHFHQLVSSSQKD